MFASIFLGCFVALTLGLHCLIVFIVRLRFAVFPISFTAQVQGGLQQLLRPTVAEVPVVVDDKLEIHGQVELVLQQFV